MTGYTVVVENETTQWHDVTGKSYHYPKRYRDLLKPGTQLLHYRSKPKTGDDRSKRLMTAPHYFARSIAGQSNPDPTSGNRDFYLDILAFEIFPVGVAAKKAGGFLEIIPPNRASNFWRDGVRASTKGVFDEVIAASGLTNEADGTDVTIADDLTSVFIEGRKKVVYSTKYERDPKLRQQAVKLHGTVCLACEVDLGKVYGTVGAGHIHIHHRRPLSQTGETIVNPKTDLVPVCPTCHSIIHLGGKLRTVNEIRAMLNRLPVDLGA